MIIPRFQKSPIDTSVVAQMMNRKAPTELTFVDHIRKAVRDVTKTDPYLNNGYREGELVKSRHLFMFFVKRYTGMSLLATGRLVGKDHASCIHAIRCVKKYIEIEPAYREIYLMIEKKLEQLKIKN